MIWKKLDKQIKNPLNLLAQKLIPLILISMKLGEQK